MTDKIIGLAIGIVVIFGTVTIVWGSANMWKR